jgi:hypothetical protein
MRRLLAALVLALSFPASAFTEPLVCEDRERVARELIARLTAERARAEVETATELARLKKLLEQVLHERDAARAKLPAGHGGR